MPRVNVPVYMLDFETTVDPEETRVWLWGKVQLGTDIFEWGSNIDSLIQSISKTTCKAYFHNLKFDIQFIFYWLFQNGYEHTSSKTLKRKQFNTLISDMGQFYSVSIRWECGTKCTLYDSLKVIPLPVSAIPKAFGLSLEKLDIDYEAVRDNSHVPTKEEVEYVHNDVKIVALALQEIQRMGMKKITAGSNALADCKGRIGVKEYERMFPFPFSM